METAMELAMRRAREAEAKRLAEAATALRETVGAWSADDPFHVDPPLPQPTPQPKENEAMNVAPTPAPSSTPPNNVAPMTTSSATFQFIKDNPGLPRQEVVNRLGKQGHNRGSVSSLIGQMVLQNYVKQEGGENRVTAVIDEYRPLKSGTIRSQLVEQRRRELMQTNPKRAETIGKMQRAMRGKNNPQTPVEKNELDKKKLKTLVVARAIMAAKRMDPRFRQFMSEKMKAGKARARGESYPEPTMPNINTNTARFQQRFEEALKAEKAKLRSQGTYKGERKVKQDNKFAKAETTRARLNGAGGVNIDNAHKAARALPPSTPYPVTDIVRERVPADLRGMSPDEIVQALSITQAVQVLAKLQQMLSK